MTLRAEDNQGIEAQLVGTTKRADGYDFMVLDDMMIFDSAKITTPAGQQILDRIADKWSLLVIALLDEKTLRFGELVKEIDGISKRMLTVTLRNLERDGLVGRTVYPEVPPRVEYELTALGRTLLGTTQALVSWSEAHQEEIARARQKFEAANGAG